MYICGFGAVFEAGFRRAQGKMAYRPGHQLGYLTAPEYAFAKRYVAELRASWLPNVEAARSRLRQLFASRIPDPRARERILAALRTRHPNASEAELVERALADFGRP
jgi:hypothetical protein